MSKFTVLRYNDLVLTNFQFFSKQTPIQTSNRNSFFKLLSSYILLTMTAFVVASVIFVLRYYSSIEFDVALRTSALAIGTSQSIGMYFCFGMNMQKINALHFKLQQIIDEPANDDGCVDHSNANILKIANSMYWACELRYRNISKKLFYYGCFQLSTFLAPLLKPILEICAGDVDIEGWALPFDVATPFDMHTISGWFLTWFCHLNVSIAYGLCMIILTIDFVGSCHYINAVCSHFELLVDAMQVDAEQQMWPNVQRKLQRAIERHTDIYEIFQLVADINSGVIFFLLPANVLLLSMSMYIMEHSDFDPAVFGMDVICVICSLLWPYLFCHFGNSTMSNVSSIGDIAYKSNWFEYPVKLQKQFIFIVMRSHRECRFVGFRLVPCTMQVFGQVLKSACSYYVFFRELSQH